MEKATAKQIGGTHYKDSGYQPVQLFVDLRLNPFQANVVKYVTRHSRKNGVEDLRKAIHYCELAMELGVSDYKNSTSGEEIRSDLFTVAAVQDFARANDLSTRESWAILNVCLGMYGSAISNINELLSKPQQCKE